VQTESKDNYKKKLEKVIEKMELEFESTQTRQTLGSNSEWNSEPLEDQHCQPF